MKQLFFKKNRPVVQLVEKPMPSLAMCLVMDFLGYATYAIPFLGEFLDILWAPISAFIFFKMFGGKRGMIGGAFNFFEELMPGLDFIPTFTITWFIQYFRRGKTTVTTLRPITR
jgi:hypothetical protein